MAQYSSRKQLLASSLQSSILRGMVEIPEEQQVEALKWLAELAAARDDAQAELDRRVDRVRDAVVQAANLGANRTRIKQIAGIGSKTLYIWINEAGVEVRAKRPTAKREGQRVRGSDSQNEISALNQRSENT